MTANAHSPDVALAVGAFELELSLVNLQKQPVTPCVFERQARAPSAAAVAGSSSSSSGSNSSSSSKLQTHEWDTAATVPQQTVDVGQRQIPEQHVTRA